MMTPEERWTRIENALEALAESQAHTDAQIRELKSQEELQNARFEARFEKQDALLEKHDAAIRDLIVVSRTLVDSQTATFTAIDRLSANIDRFLQRGPNGSS